MRKFVLSLALLVTLAGTASADIIPPDVKGVKTSLTVVGFKKFPNKGFILFPVGNPFNEKTKDQFTVLKEGEEIHFHWYRNPKVYVVDAGFDLKLIDADWFKGKGRVISKVALGRLRFVKKSSSVAKIKTVHSLDKIEKNVLAIKTTTTNYDEAGKLVDGNKIAKGSLLIFLPLLTLLAGLSFFL
jgi:hypothetical protein